MPHWMQLPPLDGYVAVCLVLTIEVYADSKHPTTKTAQWVVVVAQLAKRLLPTPEVRGSNPVISKVFTEHC